MGTSPTIEAPNSKTCRGTLTLIDAKQLALCNSLERGSLKVVMLPARQ